MDPLLPQSAHWLAHIASMVDNSRHLFVPGSLALQDAFNCMSKIAGTLVLWFANGSNCNINRKLAGNNLGCHSNASSTQVKHISSVRQDVSRFFWNSKHRMKSGIPVVFGKVSSFALKQICKEAERLQCLPVLSLAAALVPPFTNISSNVLAIPMETSSVEAQSCMDRNPCEIENRSCGPSGGLYFQNLAWDDTRLSSQGQVSSSRPCWGTSWPEKVIPVSLLRLVHEVLILHDFLVCSTEHKK
ncbi:Fatty-acid-binding protein 2 [Striga hermonthica]|uniref:Fatty-acid-binding protein 2 n=1 Tax=Striga hermonthica TaxID=68872 RepID=A0A9N7NTR4_STRHE|nr:Fatty-acid-binding protein 2 [Striga hermonthica]